MPADQERQGGAQAPYTAVVYVHGMGEQRRYEEVSRLVDALDRYAGCAEAQGTPVGRLQRIHARLEPAHAGGRDLGYLLVHHLPPGATSPAAQRSFRFHEVYWAPVAAGGRSAGAVVRWLLRQLPRPVAMLMTPWRARQRQRRAALHALWEEARRRGRRGGRRFARVLRHYDAFEAPDAWRAWPRGRFRDFLALLGQRSTGPTRRALEALARAWRRRWVRDELAALAVLATVALALALGLGGLLWAAFGVPGLLARLAQAAPAGSPAAGALAWTGAWARAHWPALALALPALLLARFLRDYLGDVQLWTTYQETDVHYRQRREILDEAVRVLEQPLLDPRCERVVVVAHSLGTAIAVDALLELGRHDRARRPRAPMHGPVPLAKLDHLVTLGSPIDKVHYFFESAAGAGHRFTRVVEELRGDLGAVPFAFRRRPHVHWVNFWDPADVVSGPLQTPSSARLPWLRVDNVRVRSWRFPAPAASHAGYFEHREVLGALFDLVFAGARSVRGAGPGARGQREAGQWFLGPGRAGRSPRPAQAAALALPWMAAAALAALGARAPGLALGCGVAAGLDAALLALAWGCSRALGHLSPLTRPTPTAPVPRAAAAGTREG